MTTTRKPAAANQEAQIVIDVPYGEKLMFPAALASVVLPHLRIVASNYTDGRDVYTVSKRAADIKLLTAEETAAAMVRGALENR